MKKTSKILSVVLAILMVISIVPITASASTTSGTCGDNKWSFDDVTGVLTISGTGSMKNYSTNYDGEKSPWYSFRDEITSVIIESGVLKIGNAAFYECVNLVSISIPNSVISIGNYAFYKCSSLTSVSIPYGVERIEDYTFSGCKSLTEVNIPESVTIIEAQAFRGCISLTNIKIPNSVTAITLAAFWYCESLTSITIPDSVTFIGAMTFMNCTNLTNIIIPDSVTEIGTDAFRDCTALADIYYGGTQEQWNQVNKTAFENVTIHYNYGKPFTGIKDNHFYKNDVMQKAYQLVEFNGDFYYIGDRHEIVKNKKVYIKEDRLNGLTYADGTPITAGTYTFDENGKMVILNGPVGDYFYKNNTQLKAYQLVEFEGDFYYIGDRHQIVKNKEVYVKAERTNGLAYADGTPIKAGTYSFDENGKMVILNGLVDDSIYKSNTQLKAYQLVEVDGDFYYISDRHKIVKNTKVYIKSERTNDLTYADGMPIQAGWYNFDENGKMIIE